MIVLIVFLSLEYPTIIDNLRIAKKVIISNMSWMGGKNYFLPIVYFIVAILCLGIGTLFIYIYIYLHPQQYPYCLGTFPQTTQQFSHFYQATQGNNNELIKPTDYIDTYL